MVNVRGAQVADGAALTRIDAATWNSEVSPAPAPAGAGDTFFEHNDPGDVLVAEVDGQVAGYATLRQWSRIPSHAHVLEINGLAVDPGRQGQGLGRALVAACVDWARRRGARKLTLRVLGGNHGARRLYESCGFHVEGVLREEFRLDGRYADDVLMARMLGPDEPRPAAGQREMRPTADGSIRDLLRGLPVFDTDLPGFHPDQAPADPVALFTDWLAAAIAAEVPEPHVMSLATVAVDGRPSSRMLILKDVGPEGRWYFASTSTSRKGRELADRPYAALGFYWPQQGRQIRVGGRVEPAGTERSRADFLARPPASRMEGLVGRQSEVLSDPAELAAALDTARAEVEADPQRVAPAWTLYGLLADEVEFWQGDRDRRHIRLRYQREGQDWSRQRLWP